MITTYQVRWNSQKADTWETEDTIISLNAMELLADYMKAKCDKNASLLAPVRKAVKPTKVIDKSMPFQILDGFKVDGEVYYRVLFENGVETEFPSKVVQLQHGKELVKFLEQRIRKQAEVGNV